MRRRELTALADAVPERAAEVARRFNAPTSVADHRQLVGKVDAVLIATSNTTHAEIACHLLEQGCTCSARSPWRPPRPTPSACSRRRSRRRPADGWAFATIQSEPGARQSLVVGGPHRHARDGRCRARKPVRIVADAHRLPPQRTLSGGGVLLDLGIT
jgi:hypothetical protein